MKIKAIDLWRATIALTKIINGQRAMPQKGKYRLARMHAKLTSEFKVVDQQRDEMIKAYGQREVKTETNAETGEVTVSPTGNWEVPADKMPEFNAALDQLGEIEVDVQPIPISCLSLGDHEDGAIESAELIILGDLVSDE